MLPWRLEATSQAQFDRDGIAALENDRMENARESQGDISAEYDAEQALRIPNDATVPEPIDELPLPYAPNDPSAVFEREAERERARAEDKKRGEYEAFIAHHSVAPWAGLEHVGTVMAADAASIVVHIGRHQYVRVELPPAGDRADRPQVGDRVSVDRSGTVTHAPAAERDRSLSLGRHEA